VRDGSAVAAISGEKTSFLDREAGPGIHRYRITAEDSSRRSFPVTVTSLPTGVPGTFLRGDAKDDGRIDISDPIVLMGHLFQGTPQPRCLDAGDADDSGILDLTDVAVLLWYLFKGASLLPPPGPGSAWFDPTPDDLSRGAGIRRRT